MSALFFSALILSFVGGIFSLTRQIDYVDGVFKGFAKAVPETAMTIVYENGEMAVGFHQSEFTKALSAYFKERLWDQYAGKYSISMTYYQHPDYPGIRKYPTAVSIRFYCDINIMVRYSETVEFYIRRNHG